MALTKVKAGHLVALDMAPLFVGKESGCFEKAVLDVETIFFANPGDNNAALAGGSIDFSTNPFTLPFFAANSGADQGDFRRGRLERLRAQFRSPCR
jgi:ABC-type nitrate/sulfonate/bicarbonate transport system substrate-binding protein